MVTFIFLRHSFPPSLQELLTRREETKIFVFVFCFPKKWFAKNYKHFREKFCQGSKIVRETLLGKKKI
jgi:hypothetical protein